jgi:hypothetical protein
MGGGIKALSSRGAVVCELDVTKPGSIAAFQKKLEYVRLDLLLNIPGELQLS